jgi:hypothetical protein
VDWAGMWHYITPNSIMSDVWCLQLVWQLDRVCTIQN